MHRGPQPSLLPEVPAPAGLGIERAEVETMMAGSCWRNVAIHSLYAARMAAAQHPTTVPYQCPFHTLHPERHWHIGSPPSQHHMERLALALLWCQQHPDELPTPSTA